MFILFKYGKDLIKLSVEPHPRHSGQRFAEINIFPSIHLHLLDEYSFIYFQNRRCVLLPSLRNSSAGDDFSGSSSSSSIENCSSSSSSSDETYNALIMSCSTRFLFIFNGAPPFSVYFFRLFIYCF